MLNAIDTISKAMAYQKYRADIKQYVIDHEYDSCEDALKGFDDCKACYELLNNQFDKKELLELIKSFD